jgi:hypothetical protein
MSERMTELETRLDNAVMDEYRVPWTNAILCGFKQPQRWRL